MTKEEAKNLMAAGESANLEKTESIPNNKGKLYKAICSFANDIQGLGKGHLLIGVRDNQKASLSGMRLSNKDCAMLTGLADDAEILPRPRVEFEKFSFSLQDLASGLAGDLGVLTVFASTQTPVRYRGRVQIRKGPRESVANRQEERLLEEKSQAQSVEFDQKPCCKSRLEDLELRLFTDFRDAAIDADIVRQNNRSTEEQMAGLGFYHLGAACPTHAAIILFGKNIKYFLPGAYIQFVRFAGSDLSTQVLEDKELTSDLASNIRQLEILIRACNQKRPVKVSPLREQILQQYPEVAIREALLNAIMHRDYQNNAPINFYWFDDFIEIRNPGGAYGAAKIQFQDGRQDYRNPWLASALKTLGYVNRFGFGLPNIAASLQKNGNPEAEIKVEEHFVGLRIAAAKEC